MGAGEAAKKWDYGALRTGTPGFCYGHPTPNLMDCRPRPLWISSLSKLSSLREVMTERLALGCVDTRQKCRKYREWSECLEACRLYDVA